MTPEQVLKAALFVLAESAKAYLLVASEGNRLVLKSDILHAERVLRGEVKG